MKKLHKSSFIQRLLKVCKSKPLLALIIAFACTVTSPVVAKIPQIRGIEYSTSQSENRGNLIEYGKQLYDLGNFPEAVEVLQQAANRYQNNGQNLQQAIALTNLSLAYQQLSLWEKAEKVINESLDLLNNLEDSANKSQILAQVLEVQGRMLFMQGKANAAITSWDGAADIYKKLGLDAAFNRSRINSAQALQALGRFLQSKKILTEVRENLKKEKDPRLKVVGLRKLGNVLQIVGDLKKAEDILQVSYAIADSLSLEKDVSETLFSLGNTASAQSELLFSLGDSVGALEEVKKALEHYKEAETTTTEPIIRLQAQLNQLRLVVKNEKLSKEKLGDVSILSDKIKSLINELPVTRVVVNAKINFARSLIEPEVKNKQDAIKILTTALKEARQLQDERAESYALGTLGRLYYENKQFDDALKLTKKALVIADKISASEISYQWKWQMARLYKQKRDVEQAESYYSGAVDTLETLRENLVAINPDIQFSFRESVEPVYRQFIQLLLESSDNISLNKQLPNKSEKLIKAREIIEVLLEAQLEYFLRSPCLTTKTEDIDSLVDRTDNKAAVIYAVILRDNLNIILKLPNKPRLRFYQIPVTREKIEEVVGQLTDDLIDVTQQLRTRENSQQLYDWLIKPLETELEDNEITNLVFVLESELLNIPMGALYDKEKNKYLIQEYAVSLTSGLQLVEPKPLKEIRLKTLTAGVVDEREVEGKKFPPLKFVENELLEIKSQVPKSTKLLNEKFTRDSIQKRLKSTGYSVVHLATHGQFSSDLEETFILTWDKLLNIKEFRELLGSRGLNRSSNIELLVLSACQTAQGDKRAALGLAGVAVQAGARSTLATLWAVDDESTAGLMREFYTQLKKPRVNKAQALQKAQLKLLEKEAEPYFWAPFVLVGNWL
ncbi:MAG: CHAT domain-containing protein [Cyanobacteria bacterium P01_D01_bin.50]